MAAPSPTAAAGPWEAFLTEQPAQSLIRSIRSGLHPRRKQEKPEAEAMVGNGVSAPQMAAVTYKAPRFCPSFRNHLWASRFIPVPLRAA